MAAARDVGFVLEGNTDRQAIEFDGAVHRQMENVFVVVVEEAGAGQGFEVADAVIHGGGSI